MLAKKFSTILFYSILISSLLFGCRNKTIKPFILNIGDGGFLSENPCGPPCFFGIIPGVSSKADAITLLRSQGLYIDCSEYDNTSQGGVRGITCRTQGLIFQNNADIVTGIGFQPPIKITVSDVIAKYGNPSAVGVAAVSLTDRQQFFTGMTLFYDGSRVSLGLSEQQSGEFNLTPDTLVEGVTYEDQDSYNRGRKYSQEWNGYSVYEQWNP
jgi:hypothetical protein